MAANATTAWEVRTTGSDTNGGGFDVAASGTDFSQQDSPQIAVTDIVANGTTTLTSATANFGTSIVGNYAYLADGSGSLTATRRRVTARASTTSITVEASVAAGTGITGNFGGGFASLTPVVTNAIRSNSVFIKAGTYTQTATVTLAVGGVPLAGFPHSKLSGYNTTRGDITPASGLTRPVIQLSTNTGLTALAFTAGGWWVENLDINCASLGTSTGMSFSSAVNSMTVRNCKIRNWTTAGLRSSSASTGTYNLISANEFTGGTSAATAAIVIDNGTNQTIERNYIHDNACSGIDSATAGCTVEFNIFDTNTGATSDGIRVSFASVVRNNTVYASGRHGILNLNSAFSSQLWKGNILANNGGFGIVGSLSTALPAAEAYDGNAYYSNTSGTRSLMDNVTGIFNSTPYTNTQDVTCSASPFTDAANADFTLNNTAGGGAALRGTAQPGAMPGLSQTGYLDFGALQASAGNTGGGGIFRSSIVGVPLS